jgi:hypothetical protein
MILTGAAAFSKASVISDFAAVDLEPAQFR